MLQLPVSSSQRVEEWDDAGPVEEDADADEEDDPLERTVIPSSQKEHVSDEGATSRGSSVSRGGAVSGRGRGKRPGAPMSDTLVKLWKDSQKQEQLAHKQVNIVE